MDDALTETRIASGSFDGPVTLTLTAGPLLAGRLSAATRTPLSVIVLPGGASATSVTVTLPLPCVGTVPSCQVIVLPVTVPPFPMDCTCVPAGTGAVITAFVTCPMLWLA